VRFIGFFNPVLTVIAFGWQELRNLINALRAPTTEGSGHKAHRLADFEFMPVHEALHHVQRLCRVTLSVEPSNFNCLLHGRFYTTKLPGGAPGLFRG